MAKVKIRQVKVLKNHTKLNDGFSFEIYFETTEDIDEDIEYKLIYVGSAEDPNYDQILDNVLVGPIPSGVHKFVFETPAPNWKAIPKSEIAGLTVILITCHFRNKEFARVGYYVNNEYESEELRINPPDEPAIDDLQRHIIDTDPRITTFRIEWDDYTSDTNN